MVVLIGVVGRTSACGGASRGTRVASRGWGGGVGGLREGGDRGEGQGEGENGFSGGQHVVLLLDMYPRLRALRLTQAVSLARRSRTLVASEIHFTERTECL